MVITGIVNQLVGSPIATGTINTDVSSTSDMGLTVLSQTFSIAKNTAGTAVIDTIINLPPNSQILSITPDVTVAWDSVTSAALTVGKTSGGSDYGSSTSVKTAGRIAFTFSATQLANMANVGASTAVYATVTQTGATTVGAMTFTITYVQVGS